MSKEKEEYSRYASEAFVIAGESEQDHIQFCRTGCSRFRIDRRKKQIEILTAGIEVRYEGKTVSGRCGYAGGGILT